jgi:multidrug efflux pump subunit AcrA (membrane-fusion protein)
VSRAFFKEADGDAPALPDRPISPHRNFVTETGLAAIEAAVGRFEAAHRDAVAKGERAAAAVGMTVTLRRSDGREQSFRIVGEDEADPSRGTVSYVSPLARAVLNRGPGEIVEIAGQEAVLLTVRREGAKPGLE